MCLPAIEAFATLTRIGVETMRQLPRTTIIIDLQNRSGESLASI
jgi:hypothetical protein